METIRADPPRPTATHPAEGARGCSTRSKVLSRCIVRRIFLATAILWGNAGKVAADLSSFRGWSMRSVNNVALSSIIVAATVVALTACSDDLEPDLAACKAKATEVYRRARVSGEERAASLRECMRAKGWPIRDACLDTPHMWESPECYLR
jgi:hypothetical protein